MLNMAFCLGENQMASILVKCPKHVYRHGKARRSLQRYRCRVVSIVSTGLPVLSQQT